MNVLLLRLSGPLQAWGVQSRFSIRDSGLEPSKSGVIGLACAAMGRSREADISDLAALKMGVRIDIPGRLEYDFHTALKVVKADGGLKECEPSRRYYLADARFCVGLSGENFNLLQQIDTALRYPIFPLYLGRKAFVPAETIWLDDGLQKGKDLEETLHNYPWLGHAGINKRPEQLQLIIEDWQGTESRPDQPLSFEERRFLPRYVRTEYMPLPPVEEDACISRA